MSRRGLTAIARSKLSRPLQVAIEHGIVDSTKSILDYGCGRGNDINASLNQT